MKKLAIPPMSALWRTTCHLLALVFLSTFMTLVCQANPSQTTDTVVMISPDHFGFNPETAVTNYFQNIPDQAADITRHNALAEFAGLRQALEAHGVQVLSMPSRDDVPTPEATFPNNWFLTLPAAHHATELYVFPMLVPTRQNEVRLQALEQRLADANIALADHHDLRHESTVGEALEGTGSLVLDRVNRQAFAALSPRTSRALTETFSSQAGYQPVFFHAVDQHGQTIYHTNVMLSIGTRFAVLCEQCIPDAKEREQVIEQLGDRELIYITPAQVSHMAGNLLELKNQKGEPLILLSQQARAHLTSVQRAALESYGTLVSAPLDTLETVGGGSARCMVAEIFTGE
ncbi:arginine deiminase-related protein [Kistimonas scapharcae]